MYTFEKETLVQCPVCGKEAKTEHGLRRHLTGRVEHGGHEFLIGDATEAAHRAARGLPPDSTSQSRRNPLVRLAQRREAGPPRTAKQAAPAPLLPYPSAGNPYEKFFYEMLTAMVRNKRLPKYQFERRIDAVLNVFLPHLLKAVYGWEVRVVVPEFPLKRAHNNQSTNVDYLLFRHAHERIPEAWLFFELKTDKASISNDQINDYLTAMIRGMPLLYADLQAITVASQQRIKYVEMLGCFQDLPLAAPIELVYLSPLSMKTRNKQVHLLTFTELEAVELPVHSDTWNMFKAVVLPSLS